MSMNNSKDAYMTMELLVGVVVIAIPFLLGLSEVYRFEHYARKMLFSGQHQCLARAFSENQGTPHPLYVSVSTNIELMVFTKRVFSADWQPTVQHIEKTYTIYTGTGKEGQ